MLHRFKTFESNKDNDFLKDLANRLVDENETEKQAQLLEELANELGLEPTSLRQKMYVVELWLSSNLMITAYKNNSWKYFISGDVPKPQKTYTDPREALLQAKKYYDLDVITF